MIAQIAGWLIGGAIAIPFHTMCGIVMAATGRKQLGNRLIEEEEQS